MIDALSSTERSVNNGTICGVVIRIMRKEKKPIKASVTATIAAIRAAPNDFTKSKKPCTGVSYPAGGAKHAPHPARFAQFKVSARLIRKKVARRKTRFAKAANVVAGRRGGVPISTTKAGY